MKRSKFTAFGNDLKICGFTALSILALIGCGSDSNDESVQETAAPLSITAGTGEVVTDILSTYCDGTGTCTDQVRTLFFYDELNKLKETITLDIAGNTQKNRETFTYDKESLELSQIVRYEPITTAKHMYNYSRNPENAKVMFRLQYTGCTGANDTVQCKTKADRYEDYYAESNANILPFYYSPIHAVIIDKTLHYDPMASLVDATFYKYDGNKITYSETQTPDLKSIPLTKNTWTYAADNMSGKVVTETFDKAKNVHIQTLIKEFNLNERGDYKDTKEYEPNAKNYTTYKYSYRKIR